MTAPLVSIIIPVGPRHASHVRVAAASALQQTVGPVEVIVVPDGGADVAPMPGVTVLPASQERRGPAATRNRGIAAAAGRFLLFLDADDWLHKHSLYLLLAAYAEGGAGYVYGDAYVPDQAGQLSARRAPDYDQLSVAHHNLHVVTALVPAEAARAVGGFDEAIDAWEDWTLWFRLARAGVCGRRTPYPVFTYRVMEGSRMTAFLRAHGGGRRQIVERCGQLHDITVGTEPLMELVRARYTDPDGRIRMGCCSGSSRARVADAEGALLGAAAPETVGPDGLILVEYAGESGSKTPFRPPWEPAPVYLGGNPANRYARVQPRTAAWLVEMGVARVHYDVPTPAQPEPLPVEGELSYGVIGQGVAESHDAETETPRRRRKKDAA